MPEPTQFKPGVRLTTGKGEKMNQWHVKISAEAFAAGMFAQAGLDISVQYGADQPEYDLVIVRGDKFLKVSVKGSQDGSWGLTQSYLENANYQRAADIWFDKHKWKTIMCFVQFKGVKLGEIPRVYLATPKEVAIRLKETAKGRGDTILYEYKKWTDRAHGAGTEDKIPDAWKISISRIEELLAEV
jgi:Holliday junction resolvase-like predicted endonuclease